MSILFCLNPLDDKTVDPDYCGEFDAARDTNFTVHLFSYESLTRENDPVLATRRIKTADQLQTIIYRGWMLKPNQYAMLYENLLAKNYKLINSPKEYQNCHYLPDSYKFIKECTPGTVWIPVEDRNVNYEQVFESIKHFGNSPLIIKDFVKSQKHYWDTACYISSAGDRDKVKSVIEKFIELQGSDLNEGIVIRQFVELNDLSIHSKSGMPLKQEYRLFFLKGKLLGVYEYWEEGQYFEGNFPPIEVFEDIVQGIESNFFSMDIAKTKEGEWIIIELGDGQVAGLPNITDRHQFYHSVREII